MYFEQIAIPITSLAFEPLVLTITVGDSYPTTAPSYSFASLLHGRWLTGERERKLISHMKSMFDAQDSDNLMRVIEWIRESAFSEMELSESDLLGPNQAKSKANQTGSDAKRVSDLNTPIPTIYHSHRITDRKSKFQAHFSRCWTMEEVTAVIAAIRDDPKCSQAVHPCIYAWRLQDSVTGEDSSGSSDDGEGGAAAYLENLLFTRHISNGLLMVTRWFGGTLLGPDRFRHISGIAEFLLNRVFDPTFLVKESPSSSSSSRLTPSQHFSMLSSASQCIQTLNSKSTEFLLKFKEGNGETSVKWSNFFSHRSQYPLHRLTRITQSDDSLQWSNYSPASVSITDS